MAFLLILSLLLSVLTASSDASHANTFIFGTGRFRVEHFTVHGSDSKQAPKCQTDAAVPYPVGTMPDRTLLVMVPAASGEFPVVHLQHGFMLKTSYYTELMQHVASHGFIVVAPQMGEGLLKEMFLFDASDEIASAAAVINWYPNNLAAAIAEGVSQYSLSVAPNLNKLALVGHSRGGKVSFGLARGVCKTSLEFIAIAGIEPKDGSKPNEPIAPPVLPGLNLTIPTLIIGAALGEQGLFGGSLLACAPEGVNQVQFFENSAPPALHFVAQEYGHMDILNQELDWWGFLTTRLCTSGSGPAGREPMRTFSGGMVVAFLQATLYEDTTIDCFLENPQMAPVKLQPPEEKGWFEACDI